ncbi:MAG: polysaccharide deacetylase family protein [Opitutales bacterium]
MADSPSQRVVSPERVRESGEASPPTIATPGVARGTYRYTSVVVDGPYIALTFDDGPSRRLTPELLDILKEREIPATFFVVGERVGANRSLLQRMVAEGHEIGNHTWDHSALEDLDRGSIRDQLMRTSYAIQAAVGERPALMRPPYGRMDADLDEWLFEKLGMTVVMWSVDSNDWRHRDAERVQEEILAETRPGAVILCHDIHPSTVAAMPATLDALLARDVTFVTVSELITRDRYTGREPGISAAR